MVSKDTQKCCKLINYRRLHRQNNFVPEVPRHPRKGGLGTMKQPRSQEPGYEALIIETIVFLVSNLSKEYDVTEHWPFDRSESLKCVV